MVVGIMVADGQMRDGEISPGGGKSCTVAFDGELMGLGIRVAE